MNGSAGSSLPRNQKQELAGSNGAVPASKTESGDPVVGLAVRIVEGVWGRDPGSCRLMALSGRRRGSQKSPLSEVKRKLVRGLKEAVC